MEQYRMVFQHDRVGRLVDAQEFEHLAFRIDRFAPDLLAELRDSCAGSLLEKGDRLILKHLYTERRVVPLDLYVREQPAFEARAAIADWGVALKDLAAANVFPGDFLLKNFGVTRHSRVVFYDYDELCLLSECNFRRLPRANHLEDEMAAEPWFSVGPSDIFPEEFPSFLGLPEPLAEIFGEKHGDLFSVDFWKGTQSRIQAGEILDVFPYPKERRLRH
jgi:isocitrate dehydrogenase kinase/phosphatase